MKRRGDYFVWGLMALSQGSDYSLSTQRLILAAGPPISLSFREAAVAGIRAADNGWRPRLFSQTVEGLEQGGPGLGFSIGGAAAQYTGFMLQTEGYRHSL